MNLTPENKSEIDSKSYEQLLEKWRFAPIGDPWFSGETGDYWKKRMTEKRIEIGNVAHVAISKKLGFGK